MRALAFFAAVLVAVGAFLAGVFVAAGFFGAVFFATGGFVAVWVVAFFADFADYEEAGVRKHFDRDDAIPILEAVAETLSRVEPWTQAAIEQALAKAGTVAGGVGRPGGRFIRHGIAMLGWRKGHDKG